MKPSQTHRPTVGSLFAGIGGFDLGFERAGFITSWQVEIHDICRSVLADRFPHAKQHKDVRTCLPELTPVDVIVGGFPCQDVSIMGRRAGLNGQRTGLFFNAMHIVASLAPRWLVLENVCGLISSHDGRDLQTVIETLVPMRVCGVLARA
uniref:DNA (cytosine-5-)-methyltransferase n=1 Tax=Conchiformibius kuhniae TaxID=211502 RepID=A0A8T9MW12_9NEIS|nr:DNA (cytosine-5-)-methyltransferase [Conchiformibius kuhniae]